MRRCISAVSVVWSSRRREARARRERGERARTSSFNVSHAIFRAPPLQFRVVNLWHRPPVRIRRQVSLVSDAILLRHWGGCAHGWVTRNCPKHTVTTGLTFCRNDATRYLSPPLTPRANPSRHAVAAAIKRRQSPLFVLPIFPARLSSTSDPASPTNKVAMGAIFAVVHGV